MTDTVYVIATTVAPTVAAHLAQHRATVDPVGGSVAPAEVPLPDAAVVGALVDAAFWASLRREEGYVPTISLAFLPPSPEIRPLTFARPLSLEPSGLARLGPAVERPGIHLGVWWHDGRLAVWGMTRTIPPFCFVTEVVAPGIIVLKHRPRQESQKFVNLAVIEGDTAKIIDERASLVPGCPVLLTGLLGMDTGRSRDAVQVLVQLAVSMRRHHRGGTLLMVPSATRAWEQSIVTPIAYAVEPAYTELAGLLKGAAGDDPEGADTLRRAVTAVAGLTAVDGATILTDQYDVVAFGAKIRRKQGGAQVEQLLLTEPVIGNEPVKATPGQLGGTRHLSAAQFVSDQHDGLALVASQDGRFTLFAWAPSEQMVHAHRVDALLI
ncbi:MAG: putative sensor domain DACNV-containing protein [Vicinamibacterales bacterium]